MSTVGNDEQWPDQVYAGTRATAGGHATQWDVPFSLVADSVVLPFTIPRSIHNREHPPATRPRREPFAPPRTINTADFPPATQPLAK